MIRRELAKDPKLAEESWDRFLPQFKKRNLTSAEKSSKRRVMEMKKQDGGVFTGQMAKKKVYTPFPPPQMPSKVRLLLFPPFPSGFLYLLARQVCMALVRSSMSWRPLCSCRFIRSISKSSPENTSSSRENASRRTRGGRRKRFVVALSYITRYFSIHPFGSWLTRLCRCICPSSSFLRIAIPICTRTWTFQISTPARLPSHLHLPSFVYPPYLSPPQQESTSLETQTTKRQAAFVAPVETAEAPVEERIKSKKRKERDGEGGGEEKEKKKEKKEKKKKDKAAAVEA
jgi:hypothetical protein